MTFEEASSKWFEEYAYLFQKQTTYTRNKQLSKRVNERFGDKPINEITRSEIQLFLNDLRKNGVNERNGKPLAYKTRKHYLTYISDVFKWCVEEEIIKKRRVITLKLHQMYTTNQKRTQLCFLSPKRYQY